MQLTISKFNAYLQEATKILANEQLRALETSAYPQLDKNAKKQLWEFYSTQLIEPKTEKQKRVEKRRQFKLLQARGLTRH